VQKKHHRQIDGQTDGRMDATIIPAWTQLIVTLCYNNLVSNKILWTEQSVIKRSTLLKKIVMFEILVWSYRTSADVLGPIKFNFRGNSEIN
jgi:hypothetical protein